MLNKQSVEHPVTSTIGTVTLEAPSQVAKQQPVPVTVVVCVRNRGSMIGRCLDSIMKANPSEIIVVDGDSTDGTAEIARSKGVTVVSDNGTGLGAARQLGASLAKNEYVIFVDSDVVVEPETFQQLLDEAHEKEYVAVMAELRTWSEKPSYWQTAERWRRQVQMRTGQAVILGCQITLVRKDLLMRIGFDPAFKGAHEDSDFWFRAWLAGEVFGHSDRAVAYHEDRRSLRDFIEQRIWYGRGFTRMIMRYGRQYLSQAAEQVDTAAGAMKLNIRFLPYIFVSWSFTALGAALECFHIVRDRELRKSLTTIQWQ
jgi:glycosyltransferase involved in cell wall biosynthesis